MGKFFPHPVGVFRTIPNPPKSRIMQKIDLSEKRPYLVISIFLPRQLVILSLLNKWGGYDPLWRGCQQGAQMVAERTGHPDLVLPWNVTAGPSMTRLPTVVGKMWILLDMAVFLKKTFF